MKNKIILFIMFPSSGHLNCTFAFAERLKQEGYTIVYAVPLNMQQFIAEQGFYAITLNPDLPIYLNGENTEPGSWLDLFLHKIADRFSNSKAQGILAIAKAFNQLVKDLNPALIFLDSFSPYPYFHLEGPKPPAMQLQIMFATKRRPGIPTLNSAYLPGHRSGKFSSLQVIWSWWKYKAIQKWEQIYNLGEDNLQVTYRAFYAQKKDIKKQLDFDYVFHPGIKALPELILAPKSLDYAEISPVKQLYLASSMNVHRKDVITDPKVQQVMDKLKATHQQKVWVLCSLGTLNMGHNKNCTRFFNNVIKAFSQEKNWEVIIATGEAKPYQFAQQTSNVHLLGRVPQLEVLPYCRAMITHGGINSMLECINNTVPMLVYPLNRKWDQTGNAARVVHYGLGLRGNLSKDSASTILKKLERLIKTSDYLERLHLMRQKINAETGLEEGVMQVNLMTDLASSNSVSSKPEQALTI